MTGITLIMVGGYGAAYVQGLPLLDAKWLVAGQLFFAVSGCIWLGVLVPLQMRQARAAKAFQPGDTPPPSYRRDSRSWLVWGIVATIPLIAAIYVMVEK